MTEELRDAEGLRETESERVFDTVAVDVWTLPDTTPQVEVKTEELALCVPNCVLDRVM